MFKRPRLSAVNRLVNASPMLALLFLAGACSGPTQTPAEPPEEAPAEAVEADLQLPAVWDTRDLGFAVKSIGVAGALGSTIAVAYEDGGLQLLNFDGERISEKTDLGVKTLGDGHYLLLSGVPVTLFPGINQSGGMQVYIHGGTLPEPLAYDLNIEQEGELAGLCTAAPGTDSDGIMRLAFWLEESADTLHSGRIVQIGEELVFLPDEPVKANAAISACLLSDSGATVYSAPARTAVALDRRGHRHIVTLDTSGNFTVSSNGGEVKTLTVRNGITVRMPALPTGMAGTGDTRGGGYPGGVVVVTGENADGEHRLIFIDPSKLTINPFALPAPTQ